MDHPKPRSLLVCKTKIILQIVRKLVIRMNVKQQRSFRVVFFSGIPHDAFTNIFDFRGGVKETQPQKPIRNDFSMYGEKRNPLFARAREMHVSPVYSEKTLDASLPLWYAIYVWYAI